MKQGGRTKGRKDQKKKDGKDESEDIRKEGRTEAKKDKSQVTPETFTCASS